MLKLPLWFVTERDQVPTNRPTNKPPDTLAFSNWPKLKAYLAQSKVSASDAVVVNERDELMAVIADVQSRGGNAVYLDPDSDGHGGKCVFLSDLVSLE